MKKTVFFLTIVLLTGIAGVQARQVVDEIRAIVYHDSGANPILTSDIKPNLDGTPRSLRDMVIEELTLLDAQRLNIKVTEADADRYLETLQKANRMSRTAMEHVMEDMGYTYEEGKERLRRQQMIEQVLDYRVKSDKRFLIQREEVEAYNAQHPHFEEAVFSLSQVVIPDVTDVQKELAHAELDQYAWEEPFEVKESELAEDMRFIVGEKPGSIVDRELVSDGLELTRLVAKKPRRQVPVDERYDFIVNNLRMQRFEGLIKEYHKQLLENASIRFTYPEDKILVLEGDDK